MRNLRCIYITMMENGPICNAALPLFRLGELSGVISEQTEKLETLFGNAVVGFTQGFDGGSRVASNAEGLRHLGFKMKDGALVGLVTFEESEGAPEEVEKIAAGSFALTGHLEKADKVGGGEGSRITLANAEVRARDREISQGVKVAGSAFPRIRSRLRRRDRGFRESGSWGCGLPLRRS